MNCVCKHARCNICHENPPGEDAAFVCLNQHVVCVSCLIEGADTMTTCPVCRQIIFVNPIGSFLKRTLDSCKECEKSTSDRTKLFHALVQHRILDFTFRSMRFFRKIDAETLKIYLTYMEEYKKVHELRQKVDQMKKDLEAGLQQLRVLQGEIHSSFEGYNTS